jgi:ribosome biogenesis protein NSA1
MYSLLFFYDLKVENHDFDLQRPIWIKDIAFLSKDGQKLAVGTAYHQLKVYDIKLKKCPIYQLNIGEYPVKSLETNQSYR